MFEGELEKYSESLVVEMTKEYESKMKTRTAQIAIEVSKWANIEQRYDGLVITIKQ
jgi:hypothetical protein